MRKRGFTLVELLAVIAILAILVIIALPNIINFYKKAKINTNSINTQNIIKTAKQFYFKNPNTRFENDEDIYSKLEINGRKPEEAEVFISNGKIAIAAVYDNYCFKKNFNEDDISYSEISPGILCSIYPKVDDKTPGILDGAGRKNNPYKIESVEDLVAFANYINSEDYLKNTGWYTSFDEDGVKINYNHYILLVNDIDIKSRRSYVNYKDKSFGDINGDGTVDTIYDELNKNAGLPCINPNRNDKLSIVFDGNNKSIRNLYANIKNTDPDKTIYLSLFGSFDGSFNATNIRNLKLEDINYTIDTAGSAYISPLLTSISSYYDNQIKNITTSGNIKAKCDKQCNVGGAFGYVFTYVGGSGAGGRHIVDNINSSVNIHVEGGSAVIGGISSSSSNYGSLVKNSYYNGNINVNVTGNAEIGGINGKALYFTNVNNVVNSNITVSAKTANIYGLADARTTNNSIFNGKITANTYQVATIGGLASGKVTNSYVHATIINNSQYRSEWPVIAGISTKGNVNNSYFIGDIEYNNEKIWGGGGPTSLISLISGKCTSINNSFARGLLKNTQTSTYETFFGYLRTNDPDNNECVINNSYYTNDTTYTGKAVLDTTGKVVDIADIKINNWFENTLNLKTAWKHKNGSYPILYSCNSYDFDADTCTYSNKILSNQKEIVIK